MNDTPHMRLRSAALPLQDGDLLAAIDLGSNSFHMVVSRYVLGQLRTVDRIREMVRLAEGLDGKGGLRADVRQRALECLSRFGQRLRDIPPQRVRAVATNTVRKLAAPQAFLVPAETALGHAIEMISGREEARLIYLGVAHAQLPRPDQLRLVIDIGGGSTECIIGSGLDAIERTRMLSETPGTPGRRVQAPRTTRSMETPACDAAYNARTTRGSFNAFIRAMIRAGFPARACRVSRSLRLSTPACRVNGDCSSCLSLIAGAMPDSCWKIWCTSAPISSLAVIRPRSV